MPFGAEVEADGRVGFRLWAPAARQVDLCLENVREGDRGEVILPMRSEQGGWYGLVTDRAAPGSRYRYRIDRDLRVPDPASRYQPDDVHGASEVIAPDAFEWRDDDWKGRPWEDVVLYELHVGTFTRQGTYTALKERLDHLVRLGITAIELMPLAASPGARNWGYDGVLPFAPERYYGQPEDLKDLVQTAHAKGLMVFLDVVYNHFGPEGNYLHLYAPQFFTERHHTPWGAAINFDGDGSRTVRDFFIHNALYWLTEYHLDGLRLDAVHAILDDSQPHVLVELAERVRRGPGAMRHVHLVLENDANEARYLERDGDGRPRWYDAQWNDDIHHALHVLATGETGGYYLDYTERPAWQLGRCLTEGFAYQGDPSPYRAGKRRGEASRDLPPTAFVSFLQNHDQIGNRAFGERITRLASPEAVRAVTAILLLAPSPPLLFMGQEWGADEPFPFFCDFGPELAGTVTEGRRTEFAKFPEFGDPEARERIPDPCSERTFESAVLDWSALHREPYRGWLALHRELLGLRHRALTPRLKGIRGRSAEFALLDERALRARWRLGDGSGLTLLANLAEQPVARVERPTGNLLYATSEGVLTSLDAATLPPWSVAWFLGEQGEI
jgi:malto-oligosyltrehalose trehalohydrolase